MIKTMIFFLFHFLPIYNLCKHHFLCCSPYSIHLPYPEFRLFCLQRFRNSLLFCHLHYQYLHPLMRFPIYPVQMFIIAQYEKGARSPKEKYLNALADIFEASPHALTVPDIDSYVGLIHTLFALEDLYGLHIGEIDGELCLRLDKTNGTTYLSMSDMFREWQEQSAKLESGEITKEEYDQWRYNYPNVKK